MIGLERIDIERVLQRLGIEAKKKAKEWEALCPNPEHKDRSPSWRIRDAAGSTRHGYHHCWPCGFGGGLVSLVMKVKGIDDADQAKAWLLEEVPVEQQTVAAVEVKVKAPSLRFRLPEEVIVAPLSKWPGPAREYAIGRGITERQVERWGIGYAVDGRLRGRIVFVLRDRNGRPVGYSARTFVGDPKRFLEPEEKEHASPSAMFGEQHWPEKRYAVFVVEGAIKGLAIERALGEDACFGATTGSEFRPLQSVKLGSFERAALLGDDDEAGDRLSDDLYARLCREVAAERLKLPADPDELPPDELRRTLIEWLRR